MKESYHDHLELTIIIIILIFVFLHSMLTLYCQKIKETKVKGK